MIDIAICILGIVGIIACGIIENIMWEHDREKALGYELELPSAQQEEAIPLAWLEEQAKWFESMDNAFAKIEANNIRVMIKKWRTDG